MIPDVLRKQLISLLMIYRDTGKKNIFIFSTPRSGSTWLMELLATQPRYKYENEPFDLRIPFIREKLGINDWTEMYNKSSEEKVYQYLEKKCKGKMHSSSPLSQPFFSPIVNAFVFKILHCCEDRINEIAAKFNGEIIFLIRHPIPVSLSRKVLPRLNAFIESDYKKNLTKEQVIYSQRIIKEGSNIEQAMLSWCLQNYVPLKSMNENWILLTYEQMVIEPEVVINHLKNRLGLSHMERIEKRLSKPSGSTNQSNSATKEVLAGNEIEQRKEYLINKWKKEINSHETENLMEMLSVFGLDIYKDYDALPDKKYWIKEP